MEKNISHIEKYLEVRKYWEWKKEDTESISIKFQYQTQPAASPECCSLTKEGSFLDSSEKLLV